MADLVVFGEDWGRFPSSTQHLILQLMDDHRVLWVNSIGMRSPKLNIYDCKRLYSKGFDALKPRVTQNKSDELSPYIIHPKVLPFHGSPLVRKINKKILQYQLSKVIKQLNFENLILWISLPTAVEMVGCLNEIASIYYCCDDFSALAGVDHNEVAILEKQLIKKVDMMLVSSKYLLNKHRSNNAILLSHGVDYRLFANSKPSPKDLPTGPVAGFYGSVSDWLDIEMVAQAATALPNWYFVFIGEIKTDISAIKNLPNVIFVGSKKHDELPAYVQHWDVAILPFKDNQQIRACNPLKLREYLASGTAIAATDFPAAREYKDVIAIKNKKEHFFQVIQRAYQTKANSKVRQQLVQKDSWCNKALDLVRLFDYLQAKNKRHLSYKCSN